MFDYLLHRLKEPSSWAGLGVFLNSLGLTTELSNSIIAVCAGLAALVAMFKRSPGSEDAAH